MEICKSLVELKMLMLIIHIVGMAADEESPQQKTPQHGNHQVRGNLFDQLLVLFPWKDEALFGTLAFCSDFLFALQIPDFAYSPNPHS